MIDEAFFRRQSNFEELMQCLVDGIAPEGVRLGHEFALGFHNDLGNFAYPTMNLDAQQQVKGLSGWAVSLFVKYPSDRERRRADWLPLLPPSLILWRADWWADHRLRLVLIFPERDYTNLAVMRRLLDADKHDRDNNR